MTITMQSVRVQQTSDSQNKPAELVPRSTVGKKPDFLLSHCVLLQVGQLSASAQNAERSAQVSHWDSIATPLLGALQGRHFCSDSAPRMESCTGQSESFHPQPDADDRAGDSYPLPSPITWPCANQDRSSEDTMCMCCDHPGWQHDCQDQTHCACRCCRASWRTPAAAHKQLRRRAKLWRSCPPSCDPGRAGGANCLSGPC